MDIVSFEHAERIRIHRPDDMYWSDRQTLIKPSMSKWSQIDPQFDWWIVQAADGCIIEMSKKLFQRDRGASRGEACEARPGATARPQPWLDKEVSRRSLGRLSIDVSSASVARPRCPLLRAACR